MDFKTSGAYSRNTTAATDSGIHVPGDWLYFNNYNYNRVIAVKEFCKKGWLDGKRTYYWSGENALYVGGDKYEGFGVADKTVCRNEGGVGQCLQWRLGDGHHRGW